MRLRCIASVFAALMFVTSTAQAATIQFSNGFETDNSGWNVFGGTFDATRVPSGTGGITSATGGFHGTGTTMATNWGGYSSVFPTGGYTTSVDIFLEFDGLNNDTRFDYTSAINNSSGNHLRDFAFNGGFYNDSDVTGSGPRYVFSASNNTGRANSFPKNPGRDPFAIFAEGWYTFQHDFYDNGGVLAVDLSILDSGGTTLHTWTLSTLTDLIAILGGNRYGWMPNAEGGINYKYNIDNSYLAFNDGEVSGEVPEPATLLMMGMGLVGIATQVRRRKKTS